MWGRGTQNEYALYVVEEGLEVLDQFVVNLTELARGLTIQQRLTCAKRPVYGDDNLPWSIMNITREAHAAAVQLTKWKPGTSSRNERDAATRVEGTGWVEYCCSTSRKLMHLDLIRATSRVDIGRGTSSRAASVARRLM